MVNAGVRGDPAEPGGELAVILKQRDGVPGLEKGLLGKIKGLLPVSRHAKAQVIYHLLVLPYKLFKGALVPLSRLPDQFLFVHFLTSDLV
jgi:hypothetical protein